MSRLLVLVWCTAGYREDVEGSGFRVNLPHILDKSRKDCTMLAVYDSRSPDKSVFVWQ